MELLFVASQYQVTDLQNACVNHIHQKINENNACTLLETAEMLQVKDLKHFAMAFIEMHTTDVLHTTGFLNLSKSLLKEVLKSDQLIVKENELFLKVLDWGKHQLKKEKKDNLKDEKEALKELLDDIFPLIRFPLMSADVLFDSVEPTKLVPQNLLYEGSIAYI